MPSPDRFVGRQSELSELEALLTEHRLVTVLGAAGMGKTRFTSEFGLHRAAEPGHEVWFCDLVHARRAEEVILTIARVLGMEFETTTPADERRAQLSDALHARSGATLLILDNFEQLAEFAPETVGWLLRETADQSKLRIVVTSRHSLDIGGEQIWALSPLGPEDAIELFTDRAAMSGATVDPADPVVAELCAKLDRLPLALELAAARARVLSPAELVSRLTERFRVLSGTRRDRDARQQTLRAAIEWSWDLLTAEEQAAFLRLSVFRGGFDVEAAEAVLCELEPWPLDLVDSLVHKSLVFRRESGRYGMFESMHEFGEERLQSSQMRDDAYRELVGWAAPRALAVSADLGTERGSTAVGWMTTELANLTAALQWARSVEPRSASELAIALSRFARFGGAVGVEDLLEIAGNQSDSSLADEVVLLRAERLAARGDYEGALGCLEDSVAPEGELLRAELERKRGRSADAMIVDERALRDLPTTEPLRRALLAHLAVCRVENGELDGAAEAAAEATQAPVGNDLHRECTVLKRLGYVAYFLGEHHSHREYTIEAAEMARKIGDRRQEALSLQALGDTAFASGRWQEALTWYDEALAAHHAVGRSDADGLILGNRAAALHRIGELEDAEALYREALQRHERTGADELHAIVQHALGVLEAEQGRRNEARDTWLEARATYARLALESDVAAMDLCIGWLHEADAQARLSAAASRFESAGDSDWAIVARVSAGASEPPPEGTPGVLVRALSGASTDADLSTLHASLFGRLARWATAPENDQNTLRVGPSARWFVLCGAERVSLSRRANIRRILDALAERRRHSPGSSIELWDLFAIGWPGEEDTDPDAAAERVYWAIKTLRNKLGFRDFLVTTDEGYALDAALCVERVE